MHCHPSDGQQFNLGFVITTPLQYDIGRPRDKQNALQFTLYGAYGLRDEQIRNATDGIDLSLKVIANFAIDYTD